MKHELHQHLTPHRQTHLLDHWDRLSADGQRRLADQIRRIDFELMARLHQQGGSGHDWAQIASSAEPPPAFRLKDTAADGSRERARQQGEAALAAGKVGVILVAGGQGSRLGFEHPKGMFPIGPLSGATLFQVLFEKLRARARRHGRPIPLYLMTSPATHEETLEYLTAQKNFGLPDDDVHVFCQGTMPAVELRTGRLLLAEAGEIFENPDGHGGMLGALARSGGLDHAARRGIEQFFYCQVDNPLVSMCDPEFLGYHLQSEAEVSTQVVAKQSLRDKVGNVVMVDGRMQVLEYSDLNPLDDAIVGRRMPDGSPVFWAGNIAVHVFDRRFLKRMASSAEGLPFHTAHKAVPHLDSQGQRVTPTEPNAIKFERFIFDLLPAAERSIVVEVDPAECFAPLKNGPSEQADTCATVQAARMTLERRWLRAAGVDVAGSLPVEISPLFAQDVQDVRERLASGDIPRVLERATLLR